MLELRFNPFAVLNHWWQVPNCVLSTQQNNAHHVLMIIQTFRWAHTNRGCVCVCIFGIEMYSEMDRILNAPNELNTFSDLSVK